MKNKRIVVLGGAGKLGRLVVESLVANPDVEVRVLVRDPTKPEAAAMRGDRVELVAFDATGASDAARADAVRGAFAVVSTVQGGPDIIIDAQLALLQAARSAGARRFIPSDYSYNFFTLPAGVNLNSDWRRELANAAKTQVTESFEVVHVLQGIFADRNVLGFLGLLELRDAAQGVVRYWGDGRTPIDWTTWEDTARFTAAAAIDEREVPSQLFFSGDRMDVLTFADTWERVHGKRLVRERLGSLEELAREQQRRFAAEPHNLFAWLPLQYARGVFGGEALLGAKLNARYPAIVAETVAEAMARGAV